MTIISAALISSCAVQATITPELDIPDRPELPAIEFIKTDGGQRCVDGRNYARLYTRERILTDHIKLLETVLRENNER
ncbi:MAG: hypothetical protein V3S69_01680 [Dehalococcoidales bacterium]